jgi:hypothetical protein
MIDLFQLESMSERPKPVRADARWLTPPRYSDFDFQKTEKRKSEKRSVFGG